VDIIEVKDLTKRFDGLVAVDHVSFTLERGEIFGFLGPNGAGKSTTISMLATILTPSGGDATISGFSIRRQRDAVRHSIGMVFQDPSLDNRLTAEENLRFHARLYGVPKEDYRRRMEEVLRLVDLWDRKRDIVETFSGGMKRRLEIARGLIHYPDVLFLDEPTIGLDPQTRALLWDYVLKLKHDRAMTIFMTTHYMDEAEYCDRIGIIDHGKIVALDTPANLKRQLGGDIVRIESSQKDALRKELEHKLGTPVRAEGNTLQFEVADGARFLPRLLQEVQTKVEAVELRKPTLDDVFLSLTGRNIRTSENPKSETRNSIQNRITKIPNSKRTYRTATRFRSFGLWVWSLFRISSFEFRAFAPRLRRGAVAGQTLWQREITRYRRDRMRIVSTIVQPVMFLIVFGSGFRQTLASGLGIDYLVFMYPGTVAMTVMGVAFFSTVSTVWDREFGFLKEVLVAPIPRTAIALGKTAGAATIASVQALILLALAPVIGVELHAARIPLLILYMLMLSLAVSGLGLLVASLMKTTESFGIVIQILIFPMFFLSGAFFPLTEVPKWMEVLSNLNPLTYGVDAFRQVILHGDIPLDVARRIFLYPLPIDGLFLVGFSTVMVLAAVIAFNKRS
jgi:daunorubicin resistance ABC transporter ATP-binding subunit/daunorubicin resistance ABC transporter membrane protein